MVDIVSNFQQGLAFGQQLRAQKQAQQDKQQLRNLAPAILQGDPDAYSQAAVIDPQAAQTYQDAGDRDYRRLTNVIGIMQKAIDSDNPVAKQTAFRTITPYLKQLTGGRPVPEQWDDSLLPGFEQLKQRVQMASQSAPGGGAKVVGNSLVDASGNVLYREPVRGVPINVADGKGGQIQMIFDPETRQVSPPSYSVNSPQGAYRVEAGNPELAAIAAADMAAGGLDQVTLPPRDVSSGGLGYTPPKPLMTEAERQRLDLARRAAERADQAAEDARVAREQANEIRRKAEEQKAQQAQQVSATRQAAMNDVIRGVARIKNALKNLKSSTIGTGPIAQYGQKYTEAGQELEAAVGAINNSLLSLTRVPGMGSQSDLEAKIAGLRFPQLGLDEAVNDRTLKGLEDFVGDLSGTAKQADAVGKQSTPNGKTVLRTGTSNGRKVVQYSDGTIDYAD